MVKSEDIWNRIGVYLVDDHPSTLAGLRAMLDVPDIEIVGEARTGREAVQSILHLQPDVAILDVRLPDMDGLHVLRLVKPEAPGTAFIMFTAFEEPTYLTGAIADGASGFALKNDQNLKILDLVRKAAAGEECLPRSFWGPLLHDLEAKRRVGSQDLMKDWPEQNVEILHFMVHGKSNQSIADLVGLSMESARFTIKKIFKKLGVSDRAHAVAQAIGKGILTMPDIKE
jgi:DNA-binding NarL/FixJ family response regulator